MVTVSYIFTARSPCKPSKYMKLKCVCSLWTALCQSPPVDPGQGQEEAPDRPWLHQPLQAGRSQSPGRQFKVFPMTGSDLFFPPAIYPTWPEQSKQQISRFWARLQLPAGQCPRTSHLPRGSLAGDAAASLRNAGPGAAWWHRSHAGWQLRYGHKSLSSTQPRCYTTRRNGARAAKQDFTRQKHPCVYQEESDRLFGSSSESHFQEEIARDIRQSWGFLRIGMVRTQDSKVTFPFVLF